MRPDKGYIKFKAHWTQSPPFPVDRILTTDPSAPYDCPERSHEIIRLIKTSDVLEQKVFAMGGHREGLIAFESTLNEAGKMILNVLEEWIK